MKRDAEVQLLLRERQKGRTQAQAAARAGMSERTARKYEQAGALPSQFKRPRTHRTRPDPFADDWPWIVAHLERDPALQAKTLFALLCIHDPARYQPAQLRTLQRHIKLWRALHGPEQEVYFPQVHLPGVLAESDFTHMTDLGVTLGGLPFPHLLYHLVLTYSNVEAVSLCFAESFEALAEGLERCLWQLGGVPQQHRTDQLSAAVRQLDQAGRHDFTDRYRALMAHYGMRPTTTVAGEAHHNGDVEQAHYRFKQAVDQALRVRGSRDFADRAAYERFLHELVRQRNLTRAVRFATEQQALRPLPATPLHPCRELRVRVSRFSTIHVLENTYSVPSRLIGMTSGRWCASPAHLPPTATATISSQRSPSAAPTTRCARSVLSERIASTCACCIWPPPRRKQRSKRPSPCSWGRTASRPLTPCVSWSATQRRRVCRP